MPKEKKEVEKTDTGETLNVGAEVNDDKDFGSSFNEAAEGKTPEEKPAETPPEKVEGAEKIDEKPTEEKPAEEKPAGELDETGKPKEKPEEDYKHKYETLQGMFTKLEGKLKDVEKEVKTKATVVEPSAEEKEKTEAEELLKELQTDPEIKEFLEEYDYLGKPLLKILKMKAAKGKSNEAGYTKEDIERSVVVAVHFAVVKNAHPDYDDIVKSEEGKPSELQKFVETYSGDDKTQVENAFKQGTASEVIDLISRYKKSKETPASVVHDDLEKKRKEKLAALETVTKKDTAVNTNTKKKVETFGEAFEEAASK
jgi:hypothetical protein